MPPDDTAETPVIPEAPQLHAPARGDADVHPSAPAPGNPSETVNLDVGPTDEDAAGGGGPDDDGDTDTDAEAVIDEEADDEPQAKANTPEGQPCWPVPDRDSFQLGRFLAGFEPKHPTATLLKVDGIFGRIDNAVLEKTGTPINRARRRVKLLERLGIFHPGEGVTKLGRLGRTLRDMTTPEGMRRHVAREALQTLCRYQLDNPDEQALPEGCSVHPFWATLKAASDLDGKIHWDEVNRELMRLLHDEEVDAAITRIRTARQDPLYTSFIGASDNGPGLLRARAHIAKPTAAAGKTQVGQLRDQRLTPFLRLAGFGGLLLDAPGPGGGGYWKIPAEVADLVREAVAIQPEARSFETTADWVKWFTEGIPVPVENGVNLDQQPPPLRLTINELTLANLKASLSERDKKLKFSDQLLASVVSSLRSANGKCFIILRGVSGSGKSKLVKVIAKALYGADTVPEPWLTFIEVRPDWTDGTPLLGHYATVEGRFIRRKFLNALLAAEDNPDKPVIVCLDEMNLAKVEYYLAEFLSAMESEHPVSIDRRGDHSVAASVKWPRNICLFGTINTDETTATISDKVLDRAQVIDTSNIQIGPLLEIWLEETSSLNDAEKRRVEEVILGAWKALHGVGAHFGFRTGEAMVRFVDAAKASSDGVLSIDEALNAQLVQKVLVKLRGEGERWEAPLRDLEAVIPSVNGAAGSAAGIVRRMRDDLQRIGTFQFWN